MFQERFAANDPLTLALATLNDLLEAFELDPRDTEAVWAIVDAEMARTANTSFALIRSMTLDSSEQQTILGSRTDNEPLVRAEHFIVCVFPSIEFAEFRFDLYKQRCRSNSREFIAVLLDEHHLDGCRFISSGLTVAAAANAKAVVTMLLERDAFCERSRLKEAFLVAISRRNRDAISCFLTSARVDPNEATYLDRCHTDGMIFELFCRCERVDIRRRARQWMEIFCTGIANPHDRIKTLVRHKDFDIGCCRGHIESILQIDDVDFLRHFMGRFSSEVSGQLIFAGLVHAANRGDLEVFDFFHNNPHMVINPHTNMVYGPVTFPLVLERVLADPRLSSAEHIAEFLDRSLHFLNYSSIKKGYKMIVNDQRVRPSSLHKHIVHMIRYSDCELLDTILWSRRSTPTCVYVAIRLAMHLDKVGLFESLYQMPCFDDKTWRTRVLLCGASVARVPIMRQLLADDRVDVVANFRALTYIACYTNNIEVNNLLLRYEPVDVKTRVDTLKRALKRREHLSSKHKDTYSISPAIVDELHTLLGVDTTRDTE